MSGKGSGWLGIGLGAVGGAINQIGQKKREKRAMQNQKELMGVQFANQSRLNEQGRDIQMQMWNYTNYGAQMEHMKDAGLNPSLMYGLGGGGGATTGGQGGGGAQGGNAPSPQPMEIGQAVQAALAASQIKVNEAKAKELDASATSTLGGEGTVGGSQVASNLASALNSKSVAELNGLGLEIGNATKEDQIDEAHYRVEGIIKQNDLTDEQANLVRAQTNATGIKMQLDKANIEVSKTQVEKMINDMQLDWQKLSAQLQSIGVANQANKLRAIEGKTNVQRIQNDFIMNALGKEIDLHRLNIDQQRIFAGLFTGILNNATGQMFATKGSDSPLSDAAKKSLRE